MDHDVNDDTRVDQLIIQKHPTHNVLQRYKKFFKHQLFVVRFRYVGNNNDYNYKQLLIKNVMCGVPFGAPQNNLTGRICKKIVIFANPNNKL